MISPRKTRFQERHKGSPHFAKYLIDQDTGFYIQEYFQDRLAFERKRVERSGKTIIMAFITIQDGLSRKQKTKLTAVISSVLSSCIRETDLQGWYKTDEVIGVLLTDLANDDKSRVGQRISGGLRNRSGPEEFDQLAIKYYVFSTDFEDHTGGQGPDVTMMDPEITKRERTRRWYLLTKRAMDIVGSALALVICAPLWVTIGLLIKITSRGPVLFRQERIGLNGKRFIFWKFRTMYINNDSKVHENYVDNLIKGLVTEADSTAEERGNGVYKITSDLRVTPVGRVLRRMSLDEIPQFLNVLKGEMSLVGPRPAIPYEVEKYALWHKRRLLEVNPGISGLWQVKGRSSTTFNDMVRWDLRYIRERSLRLDIKIILRTPWVVLTGKGAY